MSDKVEYIFKDIDMSPVIDLLKNHDISGWFTSNEGGENLRSFQKSFAEYCDTKYAFATSSGSSAIYVALRTCGVKRGDSVIVPSYTHVGSVAPIVLAGAKPLFVDVDIHGNLDSNILEDGYRAKALVAVHMLGMPCNMQKIRERFDGWIIEDASHALGSEYNDKRVGSLGDIGCFSVGGGRTKSISCGEGGVVTVNDDDLAEKCKNIRNHGDRITNVPYSCFNFRLSELNALVGLLQMPKLEEWNEWQMRNAEYLMQSLPAFLKVPETPAYAKTVRYLVGCLFDEKVAGFSRNDFLKKLVDHKWNGGIPRKNIGGGWAKLVSDIKYYHRYLKQPLPMSEKLRDESIWFDWHRPPRTKDEIDELLEHIDVVTHEADR